MKQVNKMTKLEKDIILDKAKTVIERDLYRGFSNIHSAAQVELYMDLMKLFTIPVFEITDKYNKWRQLPLVGECK